jgi:hypothetical protein
METGSRGRPLARREQAGLSTSNEYSVATAASVIAIQWQCRLLALEIFALEQLGSRNRLVDAWVLCRQGNGATRGAVGGQEQSCGPPKDSARDWRNEESTLALAP